MQHLLHLSRTPRQRPGPHKAQPAQIQLRPKSKSRRPTDQGNRETQQNHPLPRKRDARFKIQVRNCM